MWSSWPCVRTRADRRRSDCCRNVRSGTIRSTPRCSGPGSMAPASSSSVVLAEATAIMFMPNSPTPPSGTTSSSGSRSDGVDEDTLASDARRIAPGRASGVLQAAGIACAGREVNYITAVSGVRPEPPTVQRVPTARAVPDAAAGRRPRGPAARLPHGGVPRSERPQGVEGRLAPPAEEGADQRVEQGRIAKAHRRRPQPQLHDRGAHARHRAERARRQRHQAPRGGVQARRDAQRSPVA